MSDERFTTDYSDLLKNAKTFIKMDNERLTYEEVVDLLNELSEEKEYFERKKEYFLSKWSIAHAENIQLRQENKELKAEIEQSDLISEDIVCADIQHQLLKVTDENKELKIENEQLKKARDESDKFIAKKGLGAEFLNWCVAEAENDE